LIEKSDLYNKVEQYVVQVFNQAKLGHQIIHFRRTVYWLLQLKPDADEGLRIAALTHDIERAFRDPRLEEILEKSPGGFRDPVFLRKHSNHGAAIIAEFLTRQAACPKMIERVKMLVEGHEFAGTDDQNALKDADSLSYFENNVNKFLQRKSKEIGKEKVKAKFDWMFDRITSKKARQIAAPWYQQALLRLEKE
jgi:hypothetical protein